MPTQNTGTSGKFNVVIQNMRKNQYFKVSEFELEAAKPPVVDVSSNTNRQNAISAINKWINPWPEISFEKINFPKYSGANEGSSAGIYQYLGEPSNKPDYIKDYHFISLARLVDYWAEPVWDSNIIVKVNSVKFNRG